ALPFMLVDSATGASRPYQLSVAVNQGDHAPDLNLSIPQMPEPMAEPASEEIPEVTNEMMPEAAAEPMEMPVEPDVMAQPAVTAD
ncbi:hypothetical protein CS022_24855, partial [Veronia nyctiphanis]